MTYRVLLCKETSYLHITTADAFSSDCVELFSSTVTLSDVIVGDFHKIALSTCQAFCRGYLQGNCGVVVNNNEKDFN